MNIDKWGKWGVIGFLLTLPIMFWKSSRIGKTISLLTILGVLLWFAPKILDIYYFKFRYREKGLKQISELEQINRNILTLKSKSQNLDTIFEEKKKRSLENIDVIIQKQFKDILDALDIINEKERFELKTKLENLISLVETKKKDLKSIEVKEILRDVSDDMFLLSEEERNQIYQEFENLGMEVEELNEKSHRIIISNK